MIRVIKTAQDDGLKVNRRHEVGQERSLDTKNVPTSNFVGAAHGQETLSVHYSVPTEAKEMI